MLLASKIDHILDVVHKDAMDITPVTLLVAYPVRQFPRCHEISYPIIHVISNGYLMLLFTESEASILKDIVPLAGSTRHMLNVPWNTTWDKAVATMILGLLFE